MNAKETTLRALPKLRLSSFSRFHLATSVGPYLCRQHLDLDRAAWRGEFGTFFLRGGYNQSEVGRGIGIVFDTSDWNQIGFAFTLLEHFGRRRLTRASLVLIRVFLFDRVSSDGDHRRRSGNLLIWELTP